ncbi:MAG: copper homeostasis periplasmic binding protein CopC [Variovorax sp.]
MTRLVRLLVAFACALAASPVFAHGKLEASIPNNGSTLDAPPKEIRLQFSEPVEPTFTSVKLLDAAGREMATDKAQLDKSNAKTVVLGLPGLPAGAYRARWATMGHDGHRVKGELTFSVK